MVQEKNSSVHRHKEIVHERSNSGPVTIMNIADQEANYAMHSKSVHDKIKDYKYNYCD